MHRRQLLLTAAALALYPTDLGGVMPQFISPVPNRVFQRNGSGNADFRVSWKGIAASARLMDGATQIASSSSGEFSSIPSGWYDCELVDSGVVVDSMKIGVGDVYVVAGQSNSVSPLQPENYVPTVPDEGRVILSDYYRSGPHVFRDPGADPLVADWSNGVYVGGVAWLYCGLALDRSWPIMFVNVGIGNTNTYEWVQEHILRVFQAWAIYSPKAILWHQGESDCTNPPRTDSTSNMNAMVQSLREVTTTPWVVARNSTSMPLPSGYSYWPIRDAQYYVINNWSHVYAGPDTDTLRNLGSGEDPEFFGSKLQDHGELWATTMTALGI